MISKTFVKSRKTCKLNFELAPSIEADQIELVADFNHWRGIGFEKLKNGTWKLVQDVMPERSYEFRYRLIRNGSVHYLNDDTADAFVGNSFGSQNAIVNC